MSKRTWTEKLTDARAWLLAVVAVVALVVAIEPLRFWTWKWDFVAHEVKAEEYKIEVAANYKKLNLELLQISLRNARAERRSLRRAASLPKPPPDIQSDILENTEEIQRLRQKIQFIEEGK